MAIRIITESTAYPYTLIKNTFATIKTSSIEDSTIIPQTKFNYFYDNNIINSGRYVKIPFNYLAKFNESTFATENDNNFRYDIGYFNYKYNGQLLEVPIDMVVNNGALNQMANFYKAQAQSFNYLNTSTENKAIQHILKNEDIIYIIKYLRLVNSHILPKTQQMLSSTSSKIYQLYNDKVTEAYSDPITQTMYAEYIYRAKRNYTNIGFKNNTDARLYMYNGSTVTDAFAKIPVFRVETSDSSLQFYISIRNFRIPMKKIQTNSTTYIFIYPEYIFKKYIEFTDAIAYVIANHVPIGNVIDNYKFTYDYLDDAKQHLWLHEKENNENKNYGTSLGNTNSIYSFRKTV